MKIFITGGLGFIGSYVVDKLVRSGHEVAVYDALLNFTNPDKNYFVKCLNLRKQLLKQPHKVYICDIRDSQKLSKAVKEFNPEVIIHLAAVPKAKVLEKWKTEFEEINVGGTKNLLNAFEKYKARRIVYISSSMVYGHFTQIPQSENAPLNPTNIYGLTKKKAEELIRSTCKEWVILRLSGVYGFTECNRNVTQVIRDAGATKGDVVINHHERIDFTYVKDTAEGILLGAVKTEAKNRVFNISYGEEVGLLQLVETYLKYFPKLNYFLNAEGQPNTKRGVLDLSLAKALLGYRPKYDIKLGTQDLMKQVIKYNFYNSC